MELLEARDERVLELPHWSSSRADAVCAMVPSHLLLTEMATASSGLEANEREAALAQADCRDAAPELAAPALHAPGPAAPAPPRAEKPEVVEGFQELVEECREQIQEQQVAASFLLVEMLEDPKRPCSANCCQTTAAHVLGCRHRQLQEP
jgi:hypothetical protein